MTPRRLTIMIGSNAADRTAKVAAALNFIKGEVDITAVSQGVVTPDFLGVGDDYYNIVVEASTTRDIGSLTARFEACETAAGRNRDSISHVALDIDIVTVDGAVVKEREYGSLPYRQCLAMLAAGACDLCDPRDFPTKK